MKNGVDLAILRVYDVKYEVMMNYVPFSTDVLSCFCASGDC